MILCVITKIKNIKHSHLLPGNQSFPLIKSILLLYGHILLQQPQHCCILHQRQKSIYQLLGSFYNLSITLAHPYCVTIIIIIKIKLIHLRITSTIAFIVTTLLLLLTLNVTIAVSIAILMGAIRIYLSGVVWLSIARYSTVSLCSVLCCCCCCRLSRCNLHLRYLWKDRRKLNDLSLL